MSTPADAKLSVAALTALVVGSMVGAGIFSLPATFGRASGGFGAIIAWMIAGGGMLMLAFVFQSLAKRKPELDSGIYAYASAGFGNYLGFASAFGFWAGTCIGNVSYFILIKSTLGAFFPVFGDGNTITAILASSVLLWAFHFLVLRGVQEAAVINTIATVAKMIPILVFIIVVAVAFDRDLFALNFWGNAALTQAADLAHLDDYGRVGHAAAELVAAPQESLFDQVRSTMLVTVFVFLGIEGASVYSRYARSPRDVGIATVLGFVGVLCLLILITLLSYGVLLRPELAALRQPSMAGVLELIVGRWGAIFISIGLIVSVLGAFLSWTLLACEVLHAAAGDKAMPAVLARENRHGVPSAALWLTTGFVQVFLGLTFFTEAAFTLALELTSSLTLIPYLLVAAYAVKLARSGETYENGVGRRKDLLIALIATGYAVLMVFAGGLKYLLLSALIYAPGTLLYFKARREQGVVTFNAAERLVFGVAVLGAGVALVGLVSGWIVL